jgi:hypothetical protein
MANTEHLALLQQGVAVWNAWRAEKPNIRLDLTGAFLKAKGHRISHEGVAGVLRGTGTH